MLYIYRMSLLATFFFYILLLIITLLPFRVLYIFSDFMCFIMRNIVRYRQQLIRQNLKRAFPYKTTSEIKETEKKTYIHLVDYIVEGIKAFTMPKKVIVKRHKLLNPEIIQPFIKENKSIIVVTAHYNNWEWGSLSASLQTGYNAIAFYKPLRNKYIDKYLRKSRERCGTKLVSIYETSKTFEKHREEPFMYLMAADQSPSKRLLPKALWIDFLGMKTPFLQGPEKHARMNNYPVVYVDIEKKKRGYYELYLTLLTKNPNSLHQGELTKLYARKLEQNIIKKPECWLWSHNRWKHISQ